MGYVMEEAAKRKIAVVVLDRPNPINGWQIEGPAADAASRGFIAYLPAMPIRHGMTIGELARLFNAGEEDRCEAHRRAVPNWRRDLLVRPDGLAWINPSPNMRNLNQATLYPGIGAIEYSNVSVGRGTDQPFEQIGAPWIDGRALAAALNERALPGIRFYPVAFTPTSSKYAQRGVPGRVHGDHQSRRAAAGARRPRDRRGALEALRRSLPDGEHRSPARIAAGAGPREGRRRSRARRRDWSAAEARWRLLRAKYLLYK